MFSVCSLPFRLICVNEIIWIKFDLNLLRVELSFVNLKAMTGIWKTLCMKAEIQSWFNLCIEHL